MKRSLIALAVIAATLLPLVGARAQLSPGNLAVLRVGDGTQALTSLGNSIFVDQFTPRGVLVNTVAMPDTAATNNSMILSGTATSEGELTRSADRSVLAFCGYHFVRGGALTSLSAYSGTVVPRGSGTINSAGQYSMSLASATLFSGNNPRSAVTSNGTNIWAAGGNSGTLYLTPTVQPVTVQSNLPDTRYITIASSNLFLSVQSGTSGIYTLGQPQNPATPVGLTTNHSTTYSVIPTGTGSLPSAFNFNPPMTVAYVADMRSQTTGGGIQKWTNNAGSWKLAYTLGIGNPPFGAFGVAVDFSASNAVVYATTTEGNAAGNITTNRLIQITDTGAAAKPVTLATAPLNTAFKGVEFTPDLRPAILNQPSADTTTNGASLTLSVADSSLYPVTIQWLLNGKTIPGATNVSLVLTNIDSTAAGQYQAVVGDRYGAVTGLVANLTVITKPVPASITTQPESQTLYVGESATFTVTATGTPPLSYQWLSNGVVLRGQTNTALSINNVSANEAANYDVTVSNVVGGTNSTIAVLAVEPLPSPSFIAYTAPGMLYTQNFDALPDPGAGTVNATNPVTINGIDYVLGNPFDFALPALTGGAAGGLGLSNSMTGWYGLGQLNSKFGASEGDQSTGGIISFGLTNSASTNRALGLLATSSTGPVAFGAKFVNESTNVLTQIALQFTGELWRQERTNKTVLCGYLIDPSGTNIFSTNITAWLTNLSFSFPTNAASAENGAASTNQVTLGVSGQSITNWPPGAALWLVWQMTNAAGNGQGLAIDNLSFSASTPVQAPPPRITIQWASGNVVISWPANAPGFTLQQSPSLTPPAVWTTVSETVVLDAGENTVTVPLGGEVQFFRLAQ